MAHQPLTQLRDLGIAQRARHHAMGGPSADSHLEHGNLGIREFAGNPVGRTAVLEAAEQEISLPRDAGRWRARHLRGGTAGGRGGLLALLNRRRIVALARIALADALTLDDAQRGAIASCRSRDAMVGNALARRGVTHAVYDIGRNGDGRWNAASAQQYRGKNE